MPDSSLVEAIKLVGGLAGLGTAAFTIWDRTIRNRPLIEPYATADPEMVRVGFREVGTSAHLRIFNPANRSIGILSFRFPKRYSGAIDLSSDIGSQPANKKMYFIGPNETRDFEILYSDTSEKIDRKQYFWIAIYWRPINALLPRIPMLIRTSFAHLDAQQEDEYEICKNSIDRKS